MSILIKRLKHLTFKIDVDNVDDVDAFFDEYLYSVYIVKKKIIKISALYKAKKYRQQCQQRQQSLKNGLFMRFYMLTFLKCNVHNVN